MSTQKQWSVVLPVRSGTITKKIEIAAPPTPKYERAMRHLYLSQLFDEIEDTFRPERPEHQKINSVYVIYEPSKYPNPLTEENLREDLKDNQIQNIHEIMFSDLMRPNILLEVTWLR